LEAFVKDIYLIIYKVIVIINMAKLFDDIPDEMIEVIFDYLKQKELRDARVLSKRISSIASDTISTKCEITKKSFNELHERKYQDVINAKTAEQFSLITNTLYFTIKEEKQLMQYYMDCLDCDELRSEIYRLRDKLFKNLDDSKSMGVIGVPTSSSSVPDVNLNSNNHIFRSRFLYGYYIALISIVYMAFILKCSRESIRDGFPYFINAETVPVYFFDDMMRLKSDPSKRNEMLLNLQQYIYYSLRRTF